MFDLTQIPDFMSALQTALVKAAADSGVFTQLALANDPENTWLTPKAARAYLTISESSLKRLKKTAAQKLTISYALGASEPRYQLAALQRFMRDPAKIIGGAEQPSAGTVVPFPQEGKDEGRRMKVEGQNGRAQP